MVLRSHRALPAIWRFVILPGFWVLLIAVVAQAAEPWESDPIGVRAYTAYQGIDGSYNLDVYKYATTGNELAWGDSYAMNGFLAMYEGTKDTSHLDRLVEHFDVTLSNRDDERGIVDEIRGRIMPAWSSTKYTDGQHYAYHVHAGLIVHTAARFAYLVKSNPELQPLYLSKAQQYVTSIKETVDAFDSEFHALSGNEGYYSYVYGLSPYNMQNAMGMACVDLWLTTGESKYLDKATRLANYFKNDLVTVGDRYRWRYISNDSSPEDISHAAINVEFAFQCYRAGIVFNESDMQKFAATLQYISRGDDGFTNYVDGSGGGAGSDSCIMGNWAQLGYVDEQVRQTLSDYFGVWGSSSSHWTDGMIVGAKSAGYLVETSRDLALETYVSNAQPYAGNDSYSLNEDATLSISPSGVLGNDLDWEGNPLAAIKVSNPEHGSISWNTNGSFTYTPDAGWNGTDSFTYKATDSFLHSNLSTVTLSVNPINDSPVAVDDSYFLDEDATLNILPSGVLENDEDPDSSYLAALKVSDPEHGSVVWNSNGSFTYTPDANWNGADAFSYKATDGYKHSELASVTLSVNPVNDAPAAVTDRYDVPWNGALAVSEEYGVLANDIDVDGDTLEALWISSLSTKYGRLQLYPDGHFTYMPDANFTGYDEFVYKAYDGVTTSGYGHCYLTVGEPELYGDANRDGEVNGEDAAILASYWRKPVVAWDQGDFNRDGVVDDLDATILAANWGRTSSSTASAPEPGMLMLLMTAATAACNFYVIIKFCTSRIVSTSRIIPFAVTTGETR